MNATIAKGTIARGYIHIPSRLNGDTPHATTHNVVANPSTASVAMSIHLPIAVADPPPRPAVHRVSAKASSPAKTAQTKPQNPQLPPSSARNAVTANGELTTIAAATGAINLMKSAYGGR